MLRGAPSICRRQGRVSAFAKSVGWRSVVPGMNGERWSWGCDGEGAFKRGVNLHVKLARCDLRHGGVTAADP